MSHSTRLASIALSAIAVACAESTSPRDLVVPFDATVQPMLTATTTVTGAAGQEIIRADVVMTNADGSARRFTRSVNCLLYIRLYATPDRTGTPVYSDGSGPGGCKSFSRPDTLAAHASVAYSTNSVPLVYSQAVPNGQRLAPGRYYATVSVSIAELKPGTNTLPVGEVVLAAP